MCAYALLANTLLAILVPLVMNGEAKFDDKGFGDVEFEVKHKMLGTVPSILRYVIMLSIYGGFIAVMFGVYTMEPPKEICGEEGDPPLSPAVPSTRCTECCVAHARSSWIKDAASTARVLTSAGITIVPMNPRTTLSTTRSPACGWPQRSPDAQQKPWSLCPRCGALDAHRLR